MKRKTFPAPKFSLPETLALHGRTVRYRSDDNKGDSNDDSLPMRGDYGLIVPYPAPEELPSPESAAGVLCVLWQCYWGRTCLMVYGMDELESDWGRVELVPLDSRDRSAVSPAGHVV